LPDGGGFGMTCMVMNPLLVEKHTRPPNPEKRNRDGA
jgi:hypothetical protein